MALTGNETLFVLGQDTAGHPAATTQQTTTSAIAALANTEGAPFIVTAITTVGNGTLTAAGIVGGEITRSGPTSAFTDATDTAANIIAALPGAIVNGSFSALIKNTTAFLQTITAGIGVTLPATVIIPPFSVANYIGTVTSGTTVSFVHIDTTPISVGQTATAPVATTLSTVGAGTITAAGINGGITTRSGTQTAVFTDTTDIAANIIAGNPALVNKIGTAVFYTYINNTVFPATITGGTGVTVSGITIVPANSSVQYLITYTAAATITMVGAMLSYFPSSGTYINNGASAVTVANTAVTANSNIVFTLKTVGGTVSASAPNVKTITPGTGFTVAGLASDTSTYNYTILG